MNTVVSRETVADVIEIAGEQAAITSLVRVVEATVAGGIQGPPGPAGAPGAGYVHSQPSADSVWIINHNLGIRPGVAVMDVGGNEVDATVLHMTENQTRIYFNTPMAGFARLT